MMATKLKHVKFSATGPEELKALIHKRMEEEGYGSESAYILGLIIYDLYCRREHKLTAKLMSLPQAARDKAVDEIVRGFADERAEGKKRPGGWFDRRIHELAEKERKQRNGDTPPP